MTENPFWNSKLENGLPLVFENHTPAQFHRSGISRAHRIPGRTAKPGRHVAFSGAYVL